MIYRKQKDFDNFKCIADKCPKSCCIGWQIMIDEDSLDKYATTSGDFGHRLKSSINYEEGSFLQNNTRCSMLNETGLCDLQSTLGESYLCNTCRKYPRHVEEFQDIREYSLSLSCPEAVRMLMAPDYSFSFEETEDDIFDDPEEFEDFDFLLFDKLEYARDKMIELAKDSSLPFSERLERIRSSAFALQNLYDEGEIFEMDNISYEDKSTISLEYAMSGLDTLLELEVLEESWHETIRETISYWNNNLAKQFSEDATFVFEKILISLLFNYFCGAVYDGQIYARAMIAIMSTHWIMMIQAAHPNMDLAQNIYLYSREVEHSDTNVNTLISYFEQELD